MEAGWGGGHDGPSPNRPFCGGGPWDGERGSTPRAPPPRPKQTQPQGGCQEALRIPGPSSNAAPLQGLSACEKIRAALYLECSAKFRENVEDVFREAAKVALGALKKAQRQKHPRLCLLL